MTRRCVCFSVKWARLGGLEGCRPVQGPTQGWVNVQSIVFDIVSFGKANDLAPGHLLQDRPHTSCSPSDPPVTLLSVVTERCSESQGLTREHHKVKGRVSPGFYFAVAMGWLYGKEIPRSWGGAQGAPLELNSDPTIEPHSPVTIVGCDWLSSQVWIEPGPLG